MAGQGVPLYLTFRFFLTLPFCCRLSTPPSPTHPHQTHTHVHTDDSKCADPVDIGNVEEVIVDANQGSSEVRILRGRGRPHTNESSNLSNSWDGGECWGGAEGPRGWLQ